MEMQGSLKIKKDGTREGKKTHKCQKKSISQYLHVFLQNFYLNVLMTLVKKLLAYDSQIPFF